MEQIDVWMAQVLNHTANGTTMRAIETLRLLRTTAEAASSRAFASGCLVNPALGKVDTLSIRHAVHYFCGQPTKQFLRALRDTRRRLSTFKALLQSLIGNGEWSGDKIAGWIGHSTGYSGGTTPGSILSKDLALVNACINMVHIRRHVEYNGQTLESTEIVTNDSPMLPDLPQDAYSYRTSYIFES